MKKENQSIEIIGARVHNLKNVDVSIPKNKLVVVCGVSGSGKSSLAFDTLYEEGQRRYLESLSSYVRQFLGGFKKPDVEKIIGLSPTIAINQKSVSSNPRSTVGTITEIYDHLRLLFARVGIPHCPNDNIVITAQTPQEIANRIIDLAHNNEIVLLAPIISGKKGQHQAIFDEIERGGYSQVRVDGYFYPIAEAKNISLDKNKKHDIEVTVGKFFTGVKIDIQRNISKMEREALKNKNKKIDKLIKEEKLELLENIRKGLAMGQGNIVAHTKGKDFSFSENYSCSKCGFSLPKIEPRTFSFNSPFGACKNCQGLGTKLEIDLDLIINPEISLEAGAIKPWFSLSRMGRRALGANWQRFVTETIIRDSGLSPRTPFGKLPKEVQDKILYGDKENYTHLKDGDWEGKTLFEGIIPRLERLYYETESDFIRQELSKYMLEKTCPVCNGSRLREEALAVRVGGKNISELTSMAVLDLVSFCQKHIYEKMSENQKTVAVSIIKEISTKSNFLINVGLEYMNLGRSATTLSVGENQRIRLATQLGSGLSGVIYVLDEPTIGLHPRDTDRLIKTLKELRDLNNTVIVVEHDERVIESADWVIEIGPLAGEEGGKVVFEGTPSDLKKSKTLTGLYFAGKKKAQSGLSKNNSENKEFIKLYGASQFNLKNINLSIPLKKFVCVAGVSGSGKSTLMLDVFAKALQKEVLRMSVAVGEYKKLEGERNIDKVVIIDQSPIGRTPRSNPATYTGIFTPIRQFFTRLEESQIRGYGPSYFSFNVKPGRCEACRGEGFKKVEMYFLPDMYVECEVCKGTRFSPEVLDVKYKNKNIADVLSMSVKEALAFFHQFPFIGDKLKILDEIGLGYMKLGQPATTLSGGEAQRIKLSDELAKRATGRTIYILDEPTVGLHFEDTKKLLYILRSLVLKGNTVLVIEHNPDVLKESDWIIELGPEGGDKGGKIIFEGTLEEIKKKKTMTGKYLI
ncbi:MAG: excinuclease ABC subunit UvrA [Candidatus Paceibacterota bacterium]